MIKKFKFGILVGFISLLIGLTACNYQVIDVTYSYNYGYVKLPTGDVVEGNVDSWIDYKDGDQIQVVIDGNTYLSNSVNIVLVKKGA